VHLLEGMDRILAPEDPEVGAFLEEELKGEGIEITKSARIGRAEPSQAGVRLTLQSGQCFEAERLLGAAGRHPNTDGFDLQAAGLRTNARGFIEVNPRSLLASKDGIYAAGDINGLGGFTHLSHYHGTLIARTLKGEAVEADHTAIPRVTFTDPEVGSVGLSEKQALERGLRIEIARADVAQTARGEIHGEPGGLIKLIGDVDRGRLVGATIVSPRAGEMVSELSLAIKAQLPVSMLADLVHPFPTFSRVLQGVFNELALKMPTPVLLTE
jgi:pyruvate/2-oxoglutarate dehydrogenase complex dihydrolipoamide dehydrogenase (E3) component